MRVVIYIKVLSLALLLTLFLLTDHPSWAGALVLADATDKTPRITSIMSDDHHIWFAADYHGGLVLRFNREKETWDSFYYPYFYFYANIAQTESEIRFVMDSSVIKFDKNSLQWKQSKVSKPSKKTVRLERESIKFELGRFKKSWLKGIIFNEGNIDYIFLNSFIYRTEGKQVSQIFELPRLTKAKLLEHRPEMRKGIILNLDYIEKIENPFGPLKKIGDTVWFGIAFYEGEGLTGVGGLGFFDLKREMIGIIRLPPLRDCSISDMSVDGDWLWLVTLAYEEKRTSSCSGLVKFNMETGDYLVYEPPFQPPGKRNLRIYSFHKSNDQIWLATPYGITRYDEKKDLWTHYTVDKVELRKNAEASSVIESMDQPVAVLSDRLPAGEYDLIWVKWILQDLLYFEIDTPLRTTGWMKEEHYRHFERLLGEEYWEGVLYSATLFSEPDESSTVVGYIEGARVKKLVQKGGWVKVETHARWIEAKDVIPQVEILKTGKGYRIAKFKGEGRNLKELMVENANREYLQWEKALQTAEVVRDETCVIEPGNTRCKYSNPVYVHVQGLYNSRRGAKSGFYGVRFYMNPSGAEGREIVFKPTGKYILGGDDHGFGTIKAESFQHRVLIDLADYKVRPEARDKNDHVPVYEWIKFRIKVLKITGNPSTLH